MTKFSVVTSCSGQGWVEYGEHFLATFNQFWPPDVDLHIVSEHPLPIEVNGHRKVTFWPLLEHSSDANNFLIRHEFTPWVSGDATVARPPGVGPKWIAKEGHWFRFDAYKFCKKVFAIELVAFQLKTGKLFWLDADTITFAPVPSVLGLRMLPNNFALSCLARVGYHSECGFVGYNLDIPATHNFIKAFARLYSSDAVFQLAEWHDSWVFDWLRNKLQVHTYPIPHKSKGHPFINSELGQYMDHLKGKRKVKGRSQPVEQLRYRNLPYWQPPK